MSKTPEYIDEIIALGGYNPNQPRDPKGSPTGGQFASADGWEPNAAERNALGSLADELSGKSAKDIGAMADKEGRLADLDGTKANHLRAADLHAAASSAHKQSARSLKIYPQDGGDNFREHGRLVEAAERHSAKSREHYFKASGR